MNLNFVFLLNRNSVYCHIATCLLIQRIHLTLCLMSLPELKKYIFTQDYMFIKRILCITGIKYLIITVANVYVHLSYTRYIKVLCVYILYVHLFFTYAHQPLFITVILVPISYLQNFKTLPSLF